MKFVVGQQVIGNDKASRYGYTKNGWKGTIIMINEFGIMVSGKYIDPWDQTTKSGKFTVDPDCFDSYDKEDKFDKLYLTLKCS